MGLGAFLLLGVAQAATPVPLAAAPAKDFLAAVRVCGDAVGAGPLDAAKLAAGGFVPPADASAPQLYVKPGSGVAISAVDGYDSAQMCRIEGASTLTGPQLAEAMTKAFEDQPTQSDPASTTWKIGGRTVLLSWDESNKLAISVMHSN